MKIFVTGASGFVAKNIRCALSKAGHQIVSTSRKRVTPVLHNEENLQTDYSDDHSIIPHMKSAHAAIHLVGSGMQTTSIQYHMINQRLTERVIRWCKDADIPRIIYFSGLGVSADTTQGYFISKYLAEEAIRQSGLDYVIFRPSYIIGKDDYLSCNLQRQIKDGNVVIPGSGKYVMQPISIHDVVRIVIKSIHDDTFCNRTLDMVGPRIISYKSYVKMFAKNSARITHMDAEEAYRQAICGETTYYSIDDLNIMMGSFVGNHDKLASISGMKFHDFLEAGSTP